MWKSGRTAGTTTSRGSSFGARHARHGAGQRLAGRQARGKPLFRTKGRLEGCPDRRPLARRSLGGAAWKRIIPRERSAMPTCLSGWSYLGSGAKVREAVRDSRPGRLGPGVPGSLGWRLQTAGLSCSSVFCTAWLLSVCVFSLSPSIWSLREKGVGTGKCEGSSLVGVIRIGGVGSEDNWHCLRR